MTVDESNKLVIKYNDYEDRRGSSSLQKRIWKNQVDRTTALRIVVDTNILILGTEILTQLMDKRFPNGLNYPIIVIPFVVLEELDKLKTQTNTISVSARRANNYLNEQFSAKNPQLQAQSAIDRQQKVVTTKFADDEILNCCLQVREEDHKVILLSNDVNLRNKALFTDIQAFSLVAIQAKDLELDFDNVLWSEERVISSFKVFKESVTDEPKRTIHELWNSCASNIFANSLYKIYNSNLLLNEE